jgi:hypothetical protein
VEIAVGDGINPNAFTDIFRLPVSSMWVLIYRPRVEVLECGTMSIIYSRKIIL